MAQPQEAGWIDRIFNSTIGLPQQLLWRLIRAAKEDDIDLFSEKGILDWSLMPGGLGLFDDHKNDVMFDYMSKTLGFGDSGWGQFGAAVLSDPLTYLTGGATLLGKGAKSSIQANRISSVKEILKTRAKTSAGRKTDPNFFLAGGKLSEGDIIKEVGELTSQLTVKQYHELLDEAMSSLAGAGTREARKDVGRLKGHKKTFQKLMEKEGGAEMKMIDLVKNHSKRQLAIGLPVLSTLGARIPIPTQHQSWWKLYQATKTRGGEAIAQTWLTRSIMGIPFIGGALRNMVAPMRQFKGGLQIGAESRSAIRDAMKQTTPEQLRVMSHWLDEGGDLSVGISERGHKEILKLYDTKIANGSSTHEAFAHALKGIRGKEPIIETYARLKGIPLEDVERLVKEGKLNLPDDAAQFRKELKKDITTAMAESDEARRLARTGDYDNKLTWLDLEKKAGELFTERGRLGWGKIVGDASYEVGRKLRTVTNFIFKTGTETAHAQKALHQFLTEAARGHDQVNQLAKMLFAGVKQVLSKKAMKDWDEEGFTTMIGHLMEQHALQTELAHGLNLHSINPSNALKGASGLRDFADRQWSVMKVMEMVLTSKGVKAQNRKKILELMKAEVFDFLPRLDEKVLTAQMTRDIGISKRFEKVFTPRQLDRMKRNHNAHTFRQLPEWMKKEGIEQVGELTDAQLQRALNDIEAKAMGDMRPREIAAFLDDNKKLKQFRIDNKLTQAEMLALLNKKTRGKEALVKRFSTLKEFPLWNAERKGWTINQAQEKLAPFGWNLVRDEEGWYRFQSFGAKTSTARSNYGWREVEYSTYSYGKHKPVKSRGGKFATMEQAMGAMHRWMRSKHGERWRTKFGPDLEKLTPEQLKKIEKVDTIKVNAKHLNDLRAGLTAVERRTLAGKEQRFREELLPGYGSKIVDKELDALDWTRMRQAEKAREDSINAVGGPRPETHQYYEGPNVPERKLTEVGIDDPRIIRRPDNRKYEKSDSAFLENLKDDGGFIFSGKQGEKDLASWGAAYARSRVNIHELETWLKKQQKHGVTDPEIPYELLDEINKDLAEMGTKVSDLVLDQLPQEARDMFNAVRHVSASVFKAARDAGHLDAGFPIGYIGRFFTKAGRARVERVLNSMLGDAEGQLIMQRLTNKSPHMLARHYDSISIDELNSLQAELRKVSAGKHKHVKAWHEELEGIMKEEGYKVKGVRKPLKYTDKRLETDPFLATLARLANANQESSIENYFSNWMRASDLGQGESMALGGRVVAIWNDAGEPIAASRKTQRVVERKSKAPVPELDANGIPTDRTVTSTKVVEEVEEAVEAGKASWIVIKTDEGKQHIIPAAMDEENGLGFLRLGVPADEKLLDYKPTVAKSFVRASGTADMDGQFHLSSAMLKEGKLHDMVGEHVVYGSKPVILGAAKTSAQTLKITHQAWRTYDNINHMIKTFQTVFRVPFHVANLASGTFQALQAGARPTDLMHGYVDTFRLLMGNTEFIRHSDVLLSLMPGLEGFTSGHNWFRMPRLDFAQAARRNAGTVLDAPTLDKLRELNIDRVDDFTMSLGRGQRISMSEFMRAAGDMQLYGTYASSLTRGSRTIADSLMITKLQALDPTSVKNIVGRGAGKVIESLGGRPGELREVTEVVNRTATAIALMRGGHSMKSAISITRAAHVPYERLTWSEKNVIKRASLYYTFPRHYVPWAWTKFMEDPVKLAELSNLIRDKRIISTEEGRVSLTLGDYRLDVGRLNANVEATMMVAAFADSFAQPLGHAVGMGKSSMHPYDPNILTNQITDMGLTGMGGLFSGIFGSRRLLPQGRRTAMGQANAWDEARRIIWPVKLMGALNRALGSDSATPSKEEESPYVNYTWTERLIADSDFGLGVRKVRPQAEFMNAYYEYRSLVRQLSLKAAATDDPELREKYSENLNVLGEALRVIREDGDNRFKP